MTPGTISISGGSLDAKHSSSPVGRKPGSRSRWQSTCRVVHCPGAWARSRWASMPASCRPRRSQPLVLLRSSFTVALPMMVLLSRPIFESARHGHNYAGGNPSPGCNLSSTMLAVRPRFEFERDTFAFPNELVWEYHFDEATGATASRRRVPPPEYALRCFVLVRAARQFLYHARFDPATPPAPDEVFRRQVRAVLARIRAGRPRRASGSSSRASRACASSAPRGRRCEGGVRRRVALLRAAQSLAHRDAGLAGPSASHRRASCWRRSGSRRGPHHPPAALPVARDQPRDGGLRGRAHEPAPSSCVRPERPARPARLTYDRSAARSRSRANRYWRGGELTSSRSSAAGTCRPARAGKNHRAAGAIWLRLPAIPRRHDGPAQSPSRRTSPHVRSRAHWPEPTSTPEDRRAARRRAPSWARPGPPPPRAPRRSPRCSTSRRAPTSPRPSRKARSSTTATTARRASRPCSRRFRKDFPKIKTNYVRAQTGRALRQDHRGALGRAASASTCCSSPTSPPPSTSRRRAATSCTSPRSTRPTSPPTRARPAATSRGRASPSRASPTTAAR